MSSQKMFSPVSTRTMASPTETHTPVDRARPMARWEMEPLDTSLHLLGEDGHGGLRLDDVVADEHPDRDQQPAPGAAGDGGADELAGGHKAHVDAAQKENQAQICIQQAGDDSDQLAPLKPPGEELKDQKQPGHRQEGHGHLL